MLKDALNIKYWNSYYKNKNLASQSTKFAVFCKKKLKHYKGILYDIGCGNGRDSIYFNKKRIYCVGIDKSFQAIYKSKKKFSTYKNHFKKKNFCNFFSNQIISVKFSVYSRFSLHSITYEHEKQLFNSSVTFSNSLPSATVSTASSSSSVSPISQVPPLASQSCLFEKGIPLSSPTVQNPISSGAAAPPVPHFQISPLASV